MTEIDDHLVIEWEQYRFYSLTAGGKEEPGRLVPTVAEAGI